VATGKLASAGSGGGGIVASEDAAGRVDVGGSRGDDNSMTGGAEGKVGSAGSGGGGMSAVIGKLGSAGSGGGGSVTAAGGSRQLGGWFG
jgi:hypothetical protein